MERFIFSRKNLVSFDTKKKKKGGRDLEEEEEIFFWLILNNFVERATEWKLRVN